MIVNKSYLTILYILNLTLAIRCPTFTLYYNQTRLVDTFILISHIYQDIQQLIMSDRYQHPNYTKNYTRQIRLQKNYLKIYENNHN